MSAEGKASTSSGLRSVKKTVARVVGLLGLICGIGLIAIPVVSVDSELMSQDHLGLKAAMAFYVVGGFLVLFIGGVISLLLFRSARKGEREHE